MRAEIEHYHDTNTFSIRRPIFKVYIIVIFDFKNAFNLPTIITYFRTQTHVLGLGLQWWIQDFRRGRQP